MRISVLDFIASFLLPLRLKTDVGRTAQIQRFDYVETFWNIDYMETFWNNIDDGPVLMLENLESGELWHSRTAHAAGWHSLCFEQQSIDSTSYLEIDWSNDESGSRWLNPLGLSGRGDALLDSTGITLHWFEIQH